MSLLTGQDGAAGGQASGGPTGGSGGTGNQPDWRTALPDDLKNEKVFESIKGKDWAEAGPLLAKNYLHAQRLVGAEKLVLPTEHSSPEEIANFRTKLGVPAKPEEYGYKLPEGLTEDKIDKGRMDLWRKELHEAGIPKAAAERIMSKYLSEEFGATQAANAARTKQLADNELAIKQEFGLKFDEKVNYARLAIREFGTPQLTEILDQTGLGSHPDVVKLFAAIGSKLSDDRARGGGGGGANPLATPELAQDALNAFNRDQSKQKALFDAADPQHKWVVEERQKLFAAAFPSKAKE